MANELVVVSESKAIATVDRASRLYDAFLAGRSENTLVAYRQDLGAFATFLAAASGQAALNHLLTLPHGEANGVLLDYRSAMTEQGMSPATVNRRLTAVRSAIKLGRTLGLTTWVPEISSLKVQAFRDTRGPGLGGTRAILEHARSQGTLKAARDVAMIRLFFDLGLRRNEVRTLDVEHLVGDQVWILGKGRTQREARTLPPATAEAVAAWLTVRQAVAQPNETSLFVNLAKTSARGRRITGRGLHKVISWLGEGVGIKTRPHGLRHASITAALDTFNGDVRAAQQHARHASPETTIQYDDNRKDLAGRVARGLAEVLTGQ